MKEKNMTFADLGIDLDDIEEKANKAFGDVLGGITPKAFSFSQKNLKLTSLLFVNILHN